jgi:hypothetical protein
MALCVFCKRHFTFRYDLEKHLKFCPSRRGHEQEHEDDSSLITAGLVGVAIGASLGGGGESEDSGGSSGGGDFGGGGASDSFDSGGDSGGGGGD